MMLLLAKEYLNDGYPIVLYPIVEEVVAAAIVILV